MWLFNPNSINNLLLFLLQFIMFCYFIVRSRRNRELVFLYIFLIQLFIWQLFFLIRNMYFAPVAAYPLYYFLNSGYTVISYHALVMFSYYFISPVFKRESQIVFWAGLAVSAAIIVYAIVAVFPGRIETFFDPVLHVYDARPAPHRTYILFVLVVLIAITMKNMVYKIIVFRGEQRIFALNIMLTLITGVGSVVGVALLQQYYPINPNIHNTINTYLVGVLFIYLYLVYLNYSRIPFLYSDKTVLMILFIIIIISSLTTSLTFVIYEHAYVKVKDDMVKHIARDIGSLGTAGVPLRDHVMNEYGDDVGYIIVQHGDMSRVFLGDERIFTEKVVPVPRGTVQWRFHTGDEAVFYCLEMALGNDMLHVGIPYLQYRKYVHDFVMAGFVTVLAVIGSLFFFMRFIIYIGLIRPLKRLLSGIGEIHGGNLDHQIKISSQDEIGFIAQQFNSMVRALRLSGENITRSERKFRELTGMLPDIVYETDLELKVTYFNQTGLAITGFGEEDLKKGMSLHELLDDEECRRLGDLLAGKFGDDNYRIITHRIRKKNGTIISGENNAVVIFEGDAPAGLRGVIRDVTEKIRIETSLLQAQKMETIGTLASGIAHDFNNILGGIIGTVSLMEHKLYMLGTLPPDEAKEYLEILKQSTGRAGNLVKQLLTLSRRQKPVLERTDLNDVAKSVYEICVNSFDKKIRLDFIYLDGGAYVMADETQMGQVLLNLCVNAKDSMTIMRREGSELAGELSVLVERVASGMHLKPRFPEAQDRPYCRLRVRDTGVGMDADTISRIFDPFFTTKQKDRGTGLGLTMAYNIVKQHGGFIDIDSGIDSGTVVDVYILAADSSEASKGRETGDSSLRAGTGTILLVDDDAMIRKTCGEMLRALGYTVIAAQDGDECMDIYRARRGDIDAIILDVVMPVKSGNQVFDELRSIDPDVRVLVSSGYREDPRIGEMLAKGARGFIQKPYTLELLSQEVYRTITGKS